MEIISIKNGFLLATSPEAVSWLYCKDLPELHRELEFFLGAPTPPQEKTEPTEEVL